MPQSPLSISPRLLALGLLLASASALLAALYAQFALGLDPCILCLYQRIPYVVVALLAALAFQPNLPSRWRGVTLALCAVALLVNAGIAFFHVGVEQHWWAGTASCVSAAASGGGVTNLADLRAALSAPAPNLARCDEPAWALFGITMAGYNLLICLGLGLSTAALVWRGRWVSGQTAP
ncbi:MAG: disulfide bond formation protein B [Rhodospirillum sp.]|nr:disulfide bond formation protein B [Rhodospirillum sp.]MCF8489167.1 disulfide bond formation protein B [Rhodospirillum sp.]MCF8499834.1 disulfide bond formation protein B [Rhodospirillum sp.]